MEIFFNRISLSICDETDKSQAESEFENLNVGEKGK